MPDPVRLLVVKSDTAVMQHCQQDMSQYFPGVRPTFMDSIGPTQDYGYLGIFDIAILSYPDLKAEEIVGIAEAMQARAAAAKEPARTPIVLVTYFQDKYEKEASAVASVVDGFCVREARLPMDYLRVVKQKVDAAIARLPGWNPAARK